MKNTKKLDEWLAGPSEVVELYSTLAATILLVFGAAHIFTDTKRGVGYAELVGSIIMMSNLYLVGIARKIFLGRIIFLGTVLAFLAVMLITGGTDNAGIFWFFVFPVSAFFLAGKRQGIWWMIAFDVMILSLLGLATTGTIEIAYNNSTVLQLILCVTVLSIGIYGYQLSRERLAQQTRDTRHSLQNEKIRADEIVEHIAEGIVTTDANGRITFLNGVAEKMLGWQAEDLLGKKFIDAVPMLDIHGQPLASGSRPLDHVLKSTKSISTLAIYRGKGGHTVPVSVTGSSIVVDGKIIGGIGTFHDISEEQGLVRAKSEFLTLASHQLRTPISAISWVAELLLNNDAGKLTPEQHEHIAGIYTSSRRLSTLVNEMLIESSLELDTLAINPEPTDLAALSKAVIEEQTTIYRTKHRIIEHYATSLQPLLCDPEIIKLILRNLLSNAIKYSPSSSSITISIAHDEQRKLHTGSRGSVVITVEDRGYGIPAHTTGKIFTRFFRGDNILHKDTDGTGLGLYIVKRLLDYVGGQPSFTSHEGMGTIFTVALPLEGMKKHSPDRSIPLASAEMSSGAQYV